MSVQSPRLVSGQAPRLAKHRRGRVAGVVACGRPGKPTFFAIAARAKQTMSLKPREKRWSVPQVWELGQSAKSEHAWVSWPAREEKGIGSDVGDVPCRTALCQLPGTCGRVPWACAGPVLAPDGARAGATSAWLVTYWAVHSSGTAARVQPEAAAGWLPSDG
ncbi:hypothetical protein Purlil1_7197 [Purpureocillium lilacinum]|uniref:Uncharacterized protein n=1 Tax=Purpureocillium lilacinum TaxID=33203 RepID=A0ABR0BW38_PURLI|nr:hypothetical protein Purlil1_7197 [Purpureocillium lilacinum]